eukprot:gene13004-14260_t
MNFHQFQRTLTPARAIIARIGSYAAKRNHSTAKDLKTFMLEYQYVENMLEKRGPIRPKHLDYAKTYVDKKLLVAGGALVPKVDRGIIVFRTSDQKLVEDFARGDPYVTGGLVTSWKVTEWMVVIGDELFLN